MTNSMDEDEDVKVREARSVDEKVSAQDEEEENGNLNERNDVI